MNEIIKKIKEKKELSGIADSVVLLHLADYLERYKISLEKLKKSELKILVKEIRAELRKLVGQYHKTSKSKKTKKEILASHSSTAERLSFYPKLKKIIENLKPKSILDLGCGINPIALAQKEIEYFASDINENDLSIVRDYFSKNKITGKVFVYDLTKINSDLPKTDLCLIFKVLDIIGKKHAEKVISLIPAKIIIASFATKKLSGKSMNKPRRIWFEKILERRKMKYELIESENEVFYLIENSKKKENFK